MRENTSNNETLHIVRHYEILQDITRHCKKLQETAIQYKTLQEITRHCKTLRDITRHYKTLPCITKHCKKLQDRTRHCKILQGIARHCKTFTRHISRGHGLNKIFSLVSSILDLSFTSKRHFFLDQSCRGLFGSN